MTVARSRRWIAVRFGGEAPDGPGVDERGRSSRPPIVLDALGACAGHAGGAGAADLGAAAVVLVGGRDVADRGVQPHGVVVAADAGELCVERAGVGDAGEVRPVALEVAEEALDVRLGQRRRLLLIGRVSSEPFG